MAKMFYTLDEAAERLGKSADDVKKMASSGQIQEFRDRDRLMFKVEQIDLLAADEDVGGGDDADLSSVIPLADSALLDPGLLGESSLGESSLGGPSASQSVPSMGESDLGASGSVIGLAGDTGMHKTSPGEGGSKEAWDDEETSPNLSGTGSGLLGGLDDLGGSGLMSGSGGMDTAERSGVGIFDADELEDVDPAAMTQMVEGGGSGELNLENLGSGSGLMDLTRESDDTSLGAEFLEEVYPGDEAAKGTGAPAAAAAAGGLFEGGDDDDDVIVGAGTGGAMVAAEAYDGAGSGLVGGLMIGAIAALSLGIAFMVIAVLGAPDGGLMNMVADKIMIVLAALAGATLLLGGAGWAIGKRG